MPNASLTIDGTEVIKKENGVVSFKTETGNRIGLQSIVKFEDVGTYTWTKPTGINYIKVFVTGGGGGGGAGNSSYNLSSGGGAGATAIKYIDVTSVASVSVTVGNGGAGAPNDTNPGGTGGTSSFGAYCTAAGGMGGHKWNQATSYGLGGDATGGDINISGGDGGQSHPHDATDDGHDAHGGASFWGGGGQGAQWYSSTKPAQDARAYGAGGGAGQHTDATSMPGADGKSGIIIIEEYI